MANINAPKIEYFESIANEIVGKFRRLQNLVNHPGTSGDYHEEIVRTILRNFLTKRFSVKKGFIYAGPDRVSKQVDLLIIDESSPVAYVFQEGDFAIVLPEAVVAAMEIKTTLNVDGFEQSLENIASVKKLMQFPANLIGIVFGFDGTHPTDEVLDRWFKGDKPSTYKGNEVITPDAVLFFTENVLLVRGNDAGRLGPDGKYYYPLIGGDSEIKPGMDSKAYQLSWVLAMIVNACEQKEFTHSHYFADRHGFNLVQRERGAIVSHRFAFGEGKTTLNNNDEQKG